MLKFTSTYLKATAVLTKYKRYVLQQSKSNLSKGGRHGTHNASSSLYRSLRGYVDKKFNRGKLGRFTGGTQMPSLTFQMNKYGKFLDEGVNGSTSSYIKNRGTKNKFRNGKKSVPVDPIKKWCASRGINQSLAFVIARSIYQKGIERSAFFSKPFDKRYPTMMREYHSAIADDMAKNWANQIAKKLKAGKNIT